MEEYNYKLSQNNPMLTLNAITGLVTKIRSLHNSTNQNEFLKYYKYLRQQCINGPNSVATTAMTGLIELTRGPDEILPLLTLVKDMMSTISNIQNLSGIIDLIFYALFKLHCIDYDIMKNQHPLITILKRNQTCWPLILCRIEDKFRSESEVKVLQRLQPFALYVLYDYERKMDQVLQLEMLQIYRQYLDNTTRQKIIILNLPHITRSIRYCKVVMFEVPAMATYLLCAICTLLEKDQDATEAIWILHQHLMLSPCRDYSLEIVIISECLFIAPLIYMKTLCECIEVMLQAQKYPTIVTSILKSALCNWKMHFAITKAENSNDRLSNKVDELLLGQFEHNDIEPIEFDFLDEKQYIYSNVLYNDLSCEFLDALQNTTPYLLEKLFGILLGCFYDDNDSVKTLKVLDLCLKSCKMQAKLTSRMLPVLLHKLSLSMHPDIHLALLRALPQLGVLKENLSTIVMTIKAISMVSEQMHAFAISLLYDLVLVDKICFPYLEELLSKEGNPKSEHYQELAVTKAFVVSELCRGMSTSGLENYRKELAMYVSKVLIQSIDNNMAVRFTFEGLKYLCQGIDPFTTLANLSQRFEHDDRDCIVVGMCGIMSEIAQIPELPDQKCEQIVKKLFYYILNFPSASILRAAYQTLTSFTMEQLALGFPNIYINDTSILGCISGNSWISILENGHRVGLHAAADMLIQFIHNDMRTYKRSVYEVVDGHGEPLYMSLTRDNVLAAVSRYVKKHSSKLHLIQRDVYLECLRILSVKYKRPMPPMDWSFLAELKDNKDMQEYCITIAAHQSSVSGSARRLIEGLLKMLGDRNTFGVEVMYVYKNLEYLCNTIQPVLMKPFFKKTLKLALIMMEQSSKEIDFMLTKIQEILKDASISESNKMSASDTLLAIVECHELGSDVFGKVEPTVGSMPIQYLNTYCPVHYESMNDRILLRCLSIRCSASVCEEAKPFVLLDSIIDCRVMKSDVQPAFNFQEIFQKLAPVFTKHRQHAMLAPWLNELTAKILLELADRRDMRNVMFPCTILVIAVVLSSGYNTFNRDATSLEEFIEMFPFGMASLLNRKSFAPHISQFLESMYDFATNTSYKRNTMSELFARKFKHALLLMRTHDSFNDKFCWMKYIEVNF